MSPSSLMTFLYFQNIDVATPFFEETLGLQKVWDEGWVRIFRVTDTAFLGLVQVGEGELAPEQRDGALISITVEDCDAVYGELLAKGAIMKKAPKDSSRIPMRSFHIIGPEGYPFEIQQFNGEALQALFSQPLL